MRGKSTAAWMTYPSRARGPQQVDIGSAIRAARIQAGLTQGELASELGVTKPYISQIETGRTTPSADRLHVMSSLLGLDEQAIFEEKLSESGQCCLRPGNEQSLKVLARLWRSWEALEYEDLNVIWRQLQIAENRSDD